MTRKRLCKAPNRSKRLDVFRLHTKKASSLHATIRPCSSLRAAAVGFAPATMQGIRSCAADAVCFKFGGCVASSIAIGLFHSANLAGQAGIECIKQWLVFWHTSDTFFRALVRRAWRLSLEQLRDGSSH